MPQNPAAQRGSQQGPVPGEPTFMESAVAARGGDAPAATMTLDEIGAEIAARGGDAPATAAQPPIVRHRQTAAAVEAAAPPVAEGHTRLWRGNRPNETGAGLNFTNDLPGIALPFREAYGGDLSYIDVPNGRLADFEMKEGAAPGAEFHLPADLAATARVAALEAPSAPAPRALAEDVGAPGRTPDEVLLGPVVRGLDDEFGIPPQPSPAVARAAEADLTLRDPAADRADPDLVGNIRLSNLNSEQDIARVLETARAAGGDFVEARRGAQSFDDIEALAADLDMTADTLLKRRGGQAFNAEEITAARGLLVASAERVDDIARRIDEAVEPGDALNAEFHEAILRHVAIQEQVAGISAEAGRALGAMRMLANSDNVTPEMLASVLGGGMNVKDAARAIRQAGTRNPKAQARAIKAAYKPTLGDMLVEGWRALLVSGPKTILLNMLSSGATVALREPQVFAVASIIGGIRKAIGLGPQNDRVLGTEVGARVAGMLAGAVTIAKGADGKFQVSSPAGGNFLNTLKTGKTTDGRTQFEVNARQKAIPGRLGSVIRAPMTLQSASDEFVKATARAADLAGMATRIAHQEGLRGGAAQKRVAELLANPTEDMLKGAQSYARYNTFQNDLGGGGRGFNQLAAAWKAVTVVVPFVRTIINLTKQSVEHSLLAPVLKSWRQDLMAGGARSDLALAKVVTGTAWAAGFGALAQSGVVTGAPPTDPAERETLMATGWQPYSIRTPDGGYVSYRNAAPFSMFIGMAATLGQPIGQPKTDDEREALAQEMFVSFLSQMYDQAFMRGGTDAVSTLDDPSGNRLMTWAKRTVATMVVPPIVSQTAKMFNPETQAPETLGEHIAGRMGMGGGRPARNILGETTSPTGGIAALSPFTINSARTDPVANMILESGARITPPNRTIDGKRLSAEAYSEYQAEAGAQIRNNMAWYMENPQVWNSMSQEERADETKRQVDRAREAARQSLGL